jgi:5-methylcytosine-specific restriction enzyme subunit McrC
VRLGDEFKDEVSGKKCLFDEKVLAGLQSFYGDKGVPYFSLINKGVKFCEYVGVLKVGNTTIEILPKADKNEDAKSWRKVLIGMLQAVGNFKIHAPSSSALYLKTNSILELYFELYIRELEYLLHRGLVKKYRKTEGNNTALKGSIQFAKHIQYNTVHQERFYINYTTYDTEHQLHFILYKALCLLNRINTNPALSSRLGALSLNFTEMPDINVSDALFDKIQYNRKTESYKNAIDIARLLLLNYHPDLSRGANDVLALMFDMNLLWEQFVYASLRKNKESDTEIVAQTTKYFWKSKTGGTSKMRPDILIKRNGKPNIVLDTKWKNIKGANPSPEDLRQMYTYLNYYQAQKVALVYPGSTSSLSTGRYYETNSENLSDQDCSVICLPVLGNSKEWQKMISDRINNWINECK